MISNRELTFDDYLAIARRRLKAILIPAFGMAMAGLLISFAFSPKYTSNSLVLVERQTVPAGYVKPIVTASVSSRIANLQQQVLSRNRLEPVVDRLGLARKGKSVDEAIDEIQNNIVVTEADSSVPPDTSNPSSSSSNYGRRSNDMPGFYVSFTTENPQDAQAVCGEITSMLLAENLKSREQVALNTTDFLSRRLSEAKDNLDEQDKKLAVFKGHYLGQLPGDVDGNLKILIGLNTQMDASTQMLNRAQQDKTYTESVLAQQVTAWKSSQSSLTSETIGQRLAALRTQLVALQTRYTEDHPEVIRMKSDIAALADKQQEISASAVQDASADTVERKLEPPEILQLRQEIHQDENAIEKATQEQKRLQQQIDTYQSRLTLSPAVEEQYKQLTRDYDTAQGIYNSLFTNESESEIQTDLEHRQQGEQMLLLDAASLPHFPSFPVRWKFAAGGLGLGLTLGVGVALWLEFRDKTMRNEADVVAALNLAVLTSVPWVGAQEEKNWFRGRFQKVLDS
jgi:uncharacterized protein involved in exopolysaccharide biosynthesis